MFRRNWRTFWGIVLIALGLIAGGALVPIGVGLGLLLSNLLRGKKKRR